jgi:hypothetical protein
MKIIRFILWWVWDLFWGNFGPMVEDFKKEEWERFEQYEARKKLDRK